MSEAIFTMSLADTGALIRCKQISPTELVAAALRRINDLNPKLNAFLTITGELAEQQARVAEEEIQKSNYRGPLHGVPVSLKDLIYTQGIRTTAGSKILADFVPDADATVVDKLREAGAVLVGKNTMHEFAYGITNDNPHYGPVRNAWNADRSSGGSSGGSGVAVAAGMVFAAVGTDTGGSIRIPASFNGIVGLKPTYGRVSRHNVYPLGLTLDHVGPLARTVADVGIVYQTIAGYDVKDPYSMDPSLGSLGSLGSNNKLGSIGLRGSLGSMKVGVPGNYFFDDLQPDVERAVRRAISVLQELEAVIVPIKMPGMEALTAASRDTLLAEAYVVHKEHLKNRANDLGQDVRDLLERGRDIRAADYVEQQMARARIRREIELLFEKVDVIVTPTTPLTAFAIGQTKVELGGKEDDARLASTRFLRAFNASGHPALSLPCGFDADGMPIGLQIVGRMWDEEKVLQAGYAYERATEWHKKRPPSRAIQPS